MTEKMRSLKIALDSTVVIKCMFGRLG